MNETIITLIVTAIITAVGWLVTYVEDRQSQRYADQFEYISKQLEELYGPLTFLILEGLRSFKDLQDALERKNYTPDIDITPQTIKNGRISMHGGFKLLDEDKLRKGERATWLYWVENDLLPRNEKIKSLISTKTHLIEVKEGEDIPDIWFEFADRYNSWSIRHKLWQKNKVKYSLYSQLSWPGADDFSQDVMLTFGCLKKRQSHLLGLVQKKKVGAAVVSYFRD